jgi:ubiquinone biosynthesis protein Coq4
VALRLRPLLRTLPGLLQNPFALDLAVEFQHGIVDTPIMKLAFRRMLIGVGASERAFLESLTRTPLDHDALARLPETTFGGAYSRFMRTHGFDPEFHAKVFPDCVEDLERDWVFARFARLHDLHHVMLGTGVSPQEEIAMQLFLCINSRDPVATVLTMGLPYLALRYRKLGRIWTASRKLIKAGRALPNLFRFPYEKVMAEPLVDVRARVGLPAGGYAAAW